MKISNLLPFKYLYVLLEVTNKSEPLEIDFPVYPNTIPGHWKFKLKSCKTAGMSICVPVPVDMTVEQWTTGTKNLVNCTIVVVTEFGSETAPSRPLIN